MTGSCSAWYAFSGASCCRWATSRPFSRATLAWLARVSKTRRSSSTNVLTSVSRLATSSAPDGSAVGDERHDRRVLHADLGQPARQRLARREQPRPAVGQQHREVGRQLGRRHVRPAQRRRPMATIRVAGTLSRIGRQQQRRVLRPQDRAGAVHDRPLDLRQLQRPTQRPGEVVQRLEVLVPLRELECRRGSRTKRTTPRRHEHSPSVESVPDRAHEGQPDAGVRDADHAAEHDDLADHARDPASRCTTVIAHVTTTEPRTYALSVAANDRRPASRIQRGSHRRAALGRPTRRPPPRPRTSATFKSSLWHRLTPHERRRR